MKNVNFGTCIYVAINVWYDWLISTCLLFCDLGDISNMDHFLMPHNMDHFLPPTTYHPSHMTQPPPTTYHPSHMTQPPPTTYHQSHMTQLPPTTYHPSHMTQLPPTTYHPSHQIAIPAAWLHFHLLPFTIACVHLFSLVYVQTFDPTDLIFRKETDLYS